MKKIPEWPAVFPRRDGRRTGTGCHEEQFGSVIATAEQIEFLYVRPLARPFKTNPRLPAIYRRRMLLPADPGIARKSFIVRRIVIRPILINSISLITGERAGRSTSSECEGKAFR